MLIVKQNAGNSDLEALTDNPPTKIVLDLLPAGTIAEKDVHFIWDKPYIHAPDRRSLESVDLGAGKDTLRLYKMTIVYEHD